MVYKYNFYLASSIHFILEKLQHWSQVVNIWVWLVETQWDITHILKQLYKTVQYILLQVFGVVTNKLLGTGPILYSNTY